MRCTTARDCRLARVLIHEVMTESVVTAAPERTVREVAELMRERNVGSVVLVDDSRPIGFVTDRDLALSVIADGRDFVVEEVEGEAGRRPVVGHLHAHHVALEDRVGNGRGSHTGRAHVGGRSLDGLGIDGRLRNFVD